MNVPQIKPLKWIILLAFASILILLTGGKTHAAPDPSGCQTTWQDSPTDTMYLRPNTQTTVIISNVIQPQQYLVVVRTDPFVFTADQYFLNANEEPEKQTISTFNYPEGNYTVLAFHRLSDGSGDFICSGAPLTLVVTNNPPSSQPTPTPTPQPTLPPTASPVPSGVFLVAPGNCSTSFLSSGPYFVGSRVRVELSIATDGDYTNEVWRRVEGSFARIVEYGPFSLSAGNTSPYFYDTTGVGEHYWVSKNAAGVECTPRLYFTVEAVVGDCAIRFLTSGTYFIGSTVRVEVAASTGITFNNQIYKRDRNNWVRVENFGPYTQGAGDARSYVYEPTSAGEYYWVAIKDDFVACDPGTMPFTVEAPTTPAPTAAPTTNPTPSPPTTIVTGLGTIPTDPGELVQAILTWGGSIVGGLAFLMMLYGGFLILTSQGHPENLNLGREIFTGAVIGLLFVLFSVFILNLLGGGLCIPGFGFGGFGQFACT